MIGKWILVAAVAALAVASAQDVSALPPLSAADRATFFGSPEDPPAKELLGIKGYEGRHYLAGDEWNGHLWRPSLQGKGGGYIGVGADQAYLFIGWARPQLAWLIDYDVLVVRLHGVHHVFFAAAQEPKAFMRLWSDKAAGLAAIDAASEAGTQPLDAAAKAELRKTYLHARSHVSTRLRLLEKRLQKLKQTAYLNDAQDYAYVRELIQGGRVRRMSANLLETKGLIGVGDAARRLNVPVRVVYLSNAEQYWPYSKDFRANLRGLPMDAESVLIRTLSTFSINKDYRYNVQPGLTYQEFLAAGWMRHVHHMIPRRKLKDAEDIEFLVYERTPADVLGRRKPKPKSGRGAQPKQ